MAEDEDRNAYIIVIIDCFTRWVELYASPAANAKEAVKAILDYVKTFGQPHQLLSDNGGQYANEIVSALCELLGTEHVRIVPHSHEENTIVERVNKEVMRHLKALVFDDKTQSKWSKNLLFVQRIINTSVHESIGVAPYQLLFGNSIMLDRQPYLSVTCLNAERKHLAQWADEAIKAQSDFMKRATSLQTEQDRRHMEERLKRMEPLTIFEPDQYVKVAYPRGAMGQRPPSKLHMSWKGPYQVVNRRRGEYELRDPARPKTFWVSEHLISPYHVDEHSDPRKVALDESNSADIMAVLDVRGHSKLRPSIKLLIQWSDEEAPRWTDWNSSFLHNSVCQDFFWSRGRHWQNLLLPAERERRRRQADQRAV